VQIAKLLIRDFRCHGEFLVDLSPGFNIFLGANAQGKTSILEAVHYLSVFSSFRTSKPLELIRHGCPSALVAAKLGDHSLRVSFSKEGRTCLLDRKKVDDRSAWRKLLQTGKIARARQEWMRKLSPLARLAHRKISDGKEDLQLAYLDTGEGDVGAKFIRLSGEERRFRQTLAGAQLDDMILTLDGRSVTQFASEGQQRSVALALRLAQVDLLKGLHGSWPVILLDDVMGELDEGRRNRLIELGNQGAQVLLTATEESWSAAGVADIKKFQIIKQ